MIEQDCLRIGGVLVDIRAVMSVEHACAPGRCSRRTCCCAKYKVWLDREEVTRIAGMLPQAALFARHLQTESGLDNPFEELNARTYALGTDEDGLCRLAYVDADGCVRCSIHAAAENLGLDPLEVKPMSCALWPLTLDGGRPRMLSVQGDAHSFPCNRVRSSEANLDSGIAAILQSVFGGAFVQQLSR